MVCDMHAPLPAARQCHQQLTSPLSCGDQHSLDKTLVDDAIWLYVQKAIKEGALLGITSTSDSTMLHALLFHCYVSSACAVDGSNFLLT